MNPLRIIQISDTHLFAEKDQSLVGVPTQKSFEAVIDLIKQKAGEFDLIIHSGDLSQDYQIPSYTRLVEMLDIFNVPIYCVPGNHDDPEIMKKVYPYQRMSGDKHIVTKHWQIILLDSHKQDAVEGFFADDQLKHLQDCLSKNPELHSAVMFHHQPMPVGCKWLDQLGLSNADKFWKMISEHSNVKSIFYGHVHQQNEQVIKGIPCYSVPSTCFQFKRNSVDFGIEKLSPGFRWIHLYDDGHFETAVERTEQYIGTFEGDSKGY